MAYVSQTLPALPGAPMSIAISPTSSLLSGPGDFKLYLWDTRRIPDLRPAAGDPGRGIALPASGNSAGVVHAYKNISLTPGWCSIARTACTQALGEKSPWTRSATRISPTLPFSWTSLDDSRRVGQRSRHMVGGQRKPAHPSSSDAHARGNKRPMPTAVTACLTHPTQPPFLLD